MKTCDFHLIENQPLVDVCITKQNDYMGQEEVGS